jgi:hypothetical protein
MAAGEAFNANIRPQPDYFPFITTTWVGLAQAQDVIQP